jgi:MSHA biogenesis protein MshO
MKLDLKTTIKSGTARRAPAGFTLIELIVVIVIVGILSALGGQFIVAPVTGYVDLSRRAKLVDQAEMALRRMQRDIRHALPNSVRVTGTYPAIYIEMLLTEDGGRYRRYPDPDTGGKILDFSLADTSFDVLGSLSRQPTAGQHLVIYNVTAAGASGNAYATAADNRAGIADTSTTARIDLTPGFQFANASPTQRFFVVNGPVTYACEDDQLNRYDGYAISDTQPTTSLTGAALVTRGISGCDFSYDPGASQRAGLVTMRLTLEEQGQRITLLHQVHVVNAP